MVIVIVVVVLKTQRLQETRENCKVKRIIICVPICVVMCTSLLSVFCTQQDRQQRRTHDNNTDRYGHIPK